MSMMASPWGGRLDHRTPGPTPQVGGGERRAPTGQTRGRRTWCPFLLGEVSVEGYTQEAPWHEVFPMQHTQPPPPSSKKPHKWWRVLRRIALGAFALFLVGGGGAGLVVKDHVRSLWSLRRIPNTNLYVMDYYGTYNLEEVRDHGVDVSDVEGSLLRTFFPRWLVPIPYEVNRRTRPAAAGEKEYTLNHSCSTVAVHTEKGQAYCGRNFDWKHDPCLVVRVHGGERASSVAVLDPHYLGLDNDKLANPSLADRL